MPLTLSDIERITARGHRLAEFSVEEGDGWVRLRNLPDHRCFFLATDGRCRINDVKPEGCRLYPFIIDEETGDVFRDDFCPHRDEFVPPPGVERQVKGLLARLEAEADARRRA
jgi:Fe-S-cluster containining protein